MSDYNQFEEECKIIRRENNVLLDEFEQWLKSTGLSKKTVTSHRSNVEFYLNEFLLYEEAVPAKDGPLSVRVFLGYWFIKKAMWASASSIKGNAASLVKFYTFMHEKGLVDQDQLIELKKTIKDELPEWLEELERFDNMSFEDEW